MSTTVVNNYNSLSTSISNVYNNGTKYFHTNSTEADSVASGENSIAIGPKAVASGDGSVAQGYGATASATNAIAIGTNANASAANSVALGANSVANGLTLSQPAYNPGGQAAGTLPVGEVSVGSAGAERRITNVAAGAADTDAVNVSQLKGLGVTMNQHIDNRINTLDGKLSGGIAAAAALAVVTPVEPGRYHISGSVAYYNGKYGVGFNLCKSHSKIEPDDGVK